jgi:Ca-activated chloride channel family protein
MLIASMLILSVALATAASALHVALLAPPKGQPLFGEVEIIADIVPAEEAARVEFLIDGEVVGTVTSPPFKVVVDIGQENREHLLEVRAVDLDGGVSEASYRSPAVFVDDRVEARLQQLYVTVLDGGSRVLDLTQADFEVADNGAVQEMVTFSRGDVPLAAVVLTDASSSMRGRKLRFALRGSVSFAELLTPEDETSIQLFSDRLRFSSPFLNNVAGLTKGLASVEAIGGTALIDHLYRAFKQLEARQGRRVVILLSDGIDSHSSLGMQQINWLARRSRSMLYWIRIDPTDGMESRYSSWKDPDRYRDDYRMLSDVVTGTGGRIVTLDRIEDTEEAMREILRELREQYVIGYYPSTRHFDGSWHKVGVRVRRPNLQVRARDGYIDY